jgi:hypothetical protein
VGQGTKASQGRDHVTQVRSGITELAIKSKPQRQEGTAKMSACNELSSVCVVDPTYPVSKDAGEQPAGVCALLTPRPRPESTTEGSTGQIGCSLNGGPECLPCRYHKAVIPDVIPSDVRQLDEAALAAARLQMSTLPHLRP